jgi:hypothetical protein
MRAKYFTLSLISITVCHALWTFLIYGQRCRTHNSFAQSDFILFTLPLIIVLFSHVYVFQRSCSAFQNLTMIKGFGLAILAFITTFLSLWISMLIPINIYGT